MTHFYSDYIFSKNNFFQKPERIVEFANSLEFSYTHKSFPGTRTENLLTVDHAESNDFANFFIRKLLNEVYTNITDLTIDIRFHKYPVLSDNSLNEGWVHIDNHDLLAGLVYLNTDFEDFNAGTSFFTSPETISPADEIRESFNEDFESVDVNKYKELLTSYNNQFKKTIAVGNLYNRLLTYDSYLHHTPTSYSIENSDSRLILVFTISSYYYKNREYEITE